MVIRQAGCLLHYNYWRCLIDWFLWVRLTLANCSSSSFLNLSLLAREKIRNECIYSKVRCTHLKSYDQFFWNRHILTQGLKVLWLGRTDFIPMGWDFIKLDPPSGFDPGSHFSQPWACNGFYPYRFHKWIRLRQTVYRNG